jgi:hypothetical protein
MSRWADLNERKATSISIDQALNYFDEPVRRLVVGDANNDQNYAFYLAFLIGMPETTSYPTNFTMIGTPRFYLQTDGYDMANTHLGYQKIKQPLGTIPCTPEYIEKVGPGALTYYPLNIMDGAICLEEGQELIFAGNDMGEPFRKNILIEIEPCVSTTEQRCMEQDELDEMYPKLVFVVQFNYQKFQPSHFLPEKPLVTESFETLMFFPGQEKKVFLRQDTI